MAAAEMLPVPSCTRGNDGCPFCVDAKPTNLDRLFEAVNACLDGDQLDPYEDLGALAIFGKLDLRKLLALIELARLIHGAVHERLAGVA